MNNHSIHYRQEITDLIHGIIHHAELKALSVTQSQKDLSEFCIESYTDSLWYWIREEISRVRKEYETI